MHPIAKKYRDRFCSIKAAICKAELAGDKDEQLKLHVQLEELLSDFNSKYVVTNAFMVE